MGVVRTDKWLRAYKIKSKKTKTLEEQYDCQRDVITRPLCEVFSTKDEAGLHQYLLQMGLFRPGQSIELVYDRWKETSPWAIVQQQFQKLKEKWNGPDIKIYTLPMNDDNTFLSDELGGKTGLSLPHAIILFIKANVTKEDLLALITHEYHHVCRLQTIKQPEDSMKLLESLVMEGLAEFAVKEEVGPHACAAWTYRYDHVWNDVWFERWIRPNLQLKGRKNHHPFLYGSKEGGIPLWLGYYTGYKIVNTATTQRDTTSNLLGLSADLIFERSIFTVGEERNL
ncbi:DUF2268 domain-containing protein [Halalkalibacter kiskunsagensis]|uniref:DUF2268 domain-containing protein n=1 Tax=Halalkalibacter kiskunsagensis TaxID=1548599 RepID=A0ABV6KG61_9BACI